MDPQNVCKFKQWTCSPQCYTHNIISNQFAGGLLTSGMPFWAQHRYPQCFIQEHNYQPAGCQNWWLLEREVPPVLQAGSWQVSLLEWGWSVPGDRWSCWDSWSPDSLQLYSVLALSVMAGLLLVTGAAASHMCSWLRLLQLFQLNEPLTLTAKMDGAGRNCASIRTCVLQYCACTADWTLQADREDFKIQWNVLLCCSVAISLAIYWSQKKTASTHWDIEQLGEKTALRLGYLVFKVAKSRFVCCSGGGTGGGGGKGGNRPPEN